MRMKTRVRSGIIDGDATTAVQRACHFGHHRESSSRKGTLITSPASTGVSSVADSGLLRPRRLIVIADGFARLVRPPARSIAIWTVIAIS